MPPTWVPPPPTAAPVALQMLAEAAVLAPELAQEMGGAGAGGGTDWAALLFSDQVASAPQRGSPGQDWAQLLFG